MKKTLVILFTLLMLVGCSSKGYSNITNGNDVLFKGPNTTYTKADLYKVLKVASQSSIEQDILEKIAKNLKIDATSFETDADDLINNYKESGYESLIVSYYGSLDSFKQMYVSNAIVNELAKIYVNDNFDSLIQNDKPAQMQVAYFTEEEKANAVIESVNNGSTFDAAVLENGFENLVEAQIYLDSDSTLPLDVKAYLNDTDKTGISPIITISNSSTDADGNVTTSNTYYVLNVISKNVNEFKEDYISLKLGSLDDTTIKKYFFSNHEIEFYDQDIYEMMSSTYEELQ